MARPTQDAIETFMSITGASEAVAVQKLEEHGGDLNEAVNAHFNDGDRANVQPPSIPTRHDDFMSIDERADIELPQSINPLLSAVRSINPFSLLDANFGRSVLDGGGGSGFSSHVPQVSHPREVREIPIDFKDDNSAPGFSGQRPTIEDVTGSVTAHGPEIRGTVVIDDDEDDRPHTSAHPGSGIINIEDDMEDIPFVRHHGPSVTALVDETDYGNDIEEEMLQAALEASRQEAEGHSNKHFDAANNSSVPQFAGTSPSLDDIELERAVSLSLKTAEQERALREKGKEIGEGVTNSSDMEVEELEGTTMANGRQEYATERSRNTSQLIPEVKSSSYGEAEDVDEQPLVRRHSRHFGSGNLESGALDNRSPPITEQHDGGSHIQHNGDNFPSDEWGGISNEEHDEAVMLEAAMFGGIPEGSDFHFAYPTGSDRSAAMYPRAPRPPSPTLTAQRLLREQQDGEYLASLQADREKELKARQEAELRRLEEAAAKEAAVEKQRHLEEEKRKRLLEEEEFERKLTAKKASLPQEPSLEDENAITLVVRMPDGSRHGRRFLKSDKLQSLFDFIDIGRVVKPGTYRLVRPYPRRAFTDGESELSLSELGLTSKQEALYMELI